MRNEEVYSAVKDLQSRLHSFALDLDTCCQMMTDELEQDCWKVVLLAMRNRIDEVLKIMAKYDGSGEDAKEVEHRRKVEESYQSQVDC